MGLYYFNNRYWKDITREERYFCSVLFERIKYTPNEFIIWLNSKLNLNLNSKTEWEAGYEVCFYRDYYKNVLKKPMPNKFSRKRTWDLCLFSEEKIIIIEAKCQQRFKTEDIPKFKNDKLLIAELFSNQIEVEVIGLASSIYFKNLEKYGSKEIYNFFEHRFISWYDLFLKYNEQAFKYANEVYKN